MNEFLLIIGAILLWLGGWLTGRLAGHKESENRRLQEEEFAKELAALHVDPPPPLTEEEKALINRAMKQMPPAPPPAPPTRSVHNP